MIEEKAHGGYQTTIAIGAMPIGFHSQSREFITMLEARYAGFVGAPAAASLWLEVEVIEPSRNPAEVELEVGYHGGRWIMNRGDFHAEWDPAARRGSVRQTVNPYSIDSVIRILHSIELARGAGGFLLHSASAVRNGRGFLFSGVSGAGKTTISRLAPPDVTLLTDEISYVRRAADGAGYQLFGTPFAGELGIPGDNVAAPLAALYLLAQGADNRAVPLEGAPAVRRLMRNILFFADDAALVEGLFRAACEFVARVPVFELTFRRDAKVWDLIR